MKTLILILSAAALSLTGCIVVHDHAHPARGRAGLSRAPQCHPSEYWDGEHCIHKGRGQGARKHDH